MYLFLPTTRKKKKKTFRSVFYFNVSHKGLVLYKHCPNPYRFEQVRGRILMYLLLSINNKMIGKSSLTKIKNVYY